MMVLLRLPMFSGKFDCPHYKEHYQLQYSSWLYVTDLCSRLRVVHLYQCYPVNGELLSGNLSAAPALQCGVSLLGSHRPVGREEEGKQCGEGSHPLVGGRVPDWQSVRCYAHSVTCYTPASSHLEL